MYKLINQNNEVICLADAICLLDNYGMCDAEVIGFTSELRQNYYAIRINDKWGVISQDGQLRVPCKYDCVKMNTDHLYGIIEDPNNFFTNPGDDCYYTEDIYDHEGTLIDSRSYSHGNGCL